MCTINPDSAFLQNANDSPFLFLGLHRASFREGEAARLPPSRLSVDHVRSRHAARQEPRRLALPKHWTRHLGNVQLFDHSAIEKLGPQLSLLRRVTNQEALVRGANHDYQATCHPEIVTSFCATAPLWEQCQTEDTTNLRGSHS